MANQRPSITDRLLHSYRARRIEDWYYGTFHNTSGTYTIKFNDITGPYRLVMRLSDGAGMRKRLRAGTEMTERRIFLPLLKTGWICCDIGAHVGDYTVEMAMIVGSEGKVFAYEVVPHYYELLQKTIHVNKLSNVVTRLAAVGGSAGTITVPREMLTGNLARPGRIGKGNSLTHGETAVVPVVSLDDELERCDAIKIDCEGYETEVLKGMHRLISTNPNLLIFLEVHERQLGDVGSSLSEVAALLLKDYGLTVHKISSKHCICSQADLPLEGFPLITSIDEFKTAFRGT